MNRSRTKGTAAETAVVGYLNTHGFEHAERRALHGATDKGDIAGIPGVVLEVKACREMTLGPWLKEAHAEAVNARAAVAAVVHKRRGTTDPGEWFVTMDLRTFCQIVADDEYQR